ncbi:MAG: SRPBCC family protein [Myxococcota bacterium]|nr:SRPBCC family protein [Myxococcota bacterium]
MPSARHEVNIGVSIDEMMAVITDFERYPTFLPEMDSCDVLQAGGDRWDVRFTVKVVKRIRYTLRLEKVSDRSIRWSLVEGAFKSNSGGWDLTAIGDGASIRAEYFIDLQVGMFVPSSIMRTLVERTLPETVTRFKEEAERRRGASLAASVPE